MDVLPGLRSELRAVQDQIMVLKERPVPEHPHQEFADKALTWNALEEIGRRLDSAFNIMADVSRETSNRWRELDKRVDVPRPPMAHPHDDLTGGLMRLANEVAEQQVMLQDQITALQERMGDLQSLVSGLGAQMAALAERTHEENEAMRLAIGGQERVIAELRTIMGNHGAWDEELKRRLEKMDSEKANREHNHDVNRDIAEPGRRHIHEMVVKERIGSRTILKCDLPGCNAEWAETR
jgi:hypothetical protein